jgi:hypothetical protein
LIQGQNKSHQHPAGKRRNDANKANYQSFANFVSNRDSQTAGKRKRVIAFALYKLIVFFIFFTDISFEGDFMPVYGSHALFR